MTEELDYHFESDGSARIDDVWFRPVSERDRMVALFSDDMPSVIRDSKDSIIAQFDVYSHGGKEFLGYLDLYYNRYGYLRYSERRERSNGKFEMRKSNLPARLLFGTYNFPKTRPGLTYAMMKVAKKIHDHNHNSEGWKPIRKDLQKRFDPMEVVR